MINIDLIKKAPLDCIDEQRIVLEAQEYIASQLKYQNIDLEIKFVTPSVIRELNLKYRNINKTTDALTFPIYHNKSEFLNENYIHLGSIILNSEGIKQNLRVKNKELTSQCIILVIHSINHLLGKHHKE